MRTFNLIATGRLAVNYSKSLGYYTKVHCGEPSNQEPLWQNKYR